MNVHSFAIAILVQQLVNEEVVVIKFRTMGGDVRERRCQFRNHDDDTVERFLHRLPNIVLVDLDKEREDDPRPFTTVNTERIISFEVRREINYNDSILHVDAESIEVSLRKSSTCYYEYLSGFACHDANVHG